MRQNKREEGVDLGGEGRKQGTAGVWEDVHALSSVGTGRLPGTDLRACRRIQPVGSSVCSRASPGSRWRCSVIQLAGLRSVCVSVFNYTPLPLPLPLLTFPTRESCVRLQACCCSPPCTFPKHFDPVVLTS